MERSKEREHLMKLIYQMEITNSFDEDQMEIYAEKHMKGKVSEYFRNVFISYINNAREIDDIISKYSINWKVNRMPAVDAAILRLALTEIKFLDEIPEKVSINEAVELAKAFSTENSSGFINGILGKVVTQ